MAHFLKSNPRSPNLPCIWNVDNAVGQGGSNSPEDVRLVQYLIKMASKSNAISNPALKAKMAGLMVTGTCDSYTIECIKAMQTQMKTKDPYVVVDGKISRSTPALHYGNSVYVIAKLNATYRATYWANWPCISLDAADECVTELCYRELYGSPAP
jgi:hypothetical protein